MRSLIRRGSWSSKFAATISKSLYAVWVKAPLPLQSPSAQMPGAVVWQLVIDDDVAALIAADSCFIETEIVGIRPTADGQQQMRASDFGGAGCAIDFGDDLVAAFDKADAFGIQPDL